jgi:hypothetical protein
MSRQASNPHNRPQIAPIELHDSPRELQKTLRVRLRSFGLTLALGLRGDGSGSEFLPALSIRELRVSQAFIQFHSLELKNGHSGLPRVELQSAIDRNLHP